MKCIKIILLLLLFLDTSNAKDINASINTNDEYVDLDFKNLKIIDFIKFTSKILNKNILLTDSIGGKVDYIAVKPVKKSELIDILLKVLKSKGKTLAGSGNFLQVVRSVEAVKEATPILYTRNIRNKIKYDERYLTTEFIDLKYENADVVAAKIRHLGSKDGRILTNINTNTIIITDYPINLETIKKAIKIISRNTKKVLKIIKLKNINLSTASSHIKRVASALYKSTVIPQRVTTLDLRSNNSLILIGHKKQVNYLAKYLKDLDDRATSLDKDIIRVIYLKNETVKSILTTIQNVLAHKQKKVGKKQLYLSGNNEANSITMVGSQEDIDSAVKIVALLDKPKQQVYVNVKILEMSKKVTDKLGVKYGAQGGMLLGSGLLNFALNLGGGVSSAAGKALVSNLSATKTQGAILNAGVDFLVDNSMAKVVSEPSVISINNKESSIKVGERRSILTSTTSTTSTVNNSYKREDIGLELKVKPRISSDRKLTLEVKVKLEDVVEGTGGSSTPTTTKREIVTTAIVKDSESVIIGGLIKRKKTNAIGGIDFFSTIPIIGPLFGGHTDSVDNVNLVIIMTPYIIDSNSSLSKLREQLLELDTMKQQYLKTIKQRAKSFQEDFTLHDINK